MSSVTIELNDEGIQALLKSEEMKNLVDSLATSIANRAGEGYAHDIKMMDTRVIASAYTETTEAIRDNAENNTLLRAIG